MLRVGVHSQISSSHVKMPKQWLVTDAHVLCLWSLVVLLEEAEVVCSFSFLICIYFLYSELRYIAANFVIKRMSSPGFINTFWHILPATQVGSCLCFLFLLRGMTTHLDYRVLAETLHPISHWCSPGLLLPWPCCTKAFIPLLLFIIFLQDIAIFCLIFIYLFARYIGFFHRSKRIPSISPPI